MKTVQYPAAFAILCALLWPTPPALGAGVQNAEVRASVHYGRATSTDSSLATGLELAPGLEVGLGEAARVVASARISWDGRERIVPGRPDTDTYAPASRPATPGDATIAELRDAYVEFFLPSGLLRVGKQQIVWGALDGLKVLDALNPQHFREFILEDFSESRIGLWSLYADVNLGAWRTEVAWIPDATGHEIPTEGAWFELTAPRFRYGAPAGSPRPPVRTERPSHGVGRSALGVRLSRMVAGWDLSLVAISGYDFEPLGRLTNSPAGPVLERYYERRELYGLSAARAIGRVVLRTELAARPGRRFNLRLPAALTAEALDQYTAGVGLDLNGPFDTFISAQYLVDHIQSAPAGLVRPATDRLATLLVRRSFAHDRFAAELRWYGDVARGDGILRGALTWLAGDETSLRVGFDTFHGDADGLFGQFADRDRLTLRLEHYF